MQRCIKYIFCSRELWLMYNGAAMFALRELHDNVKGLFDAIGSDTPEGTDALVTAFRILAENGNAARKYIGYDTAELPTADEIAALSTVHDLSRMRNAVASAVVAGLGQEITSENKEEEIDLGLEELNAKKKTH